MTHFLSKILVVLLLGILVGCGSDGTSQSGDAVPPDESVVPDSMTIARMLETDDRFSTLRAAFDSTGLDSLLARRRPLTLFAPPDEAFRQLPPGTMETLLADRHERLQMILAKHVVEGRLSLEEDSTPQRVIAMSGDTLRVGRSADRSTTIDGISVLDANIEASNGLIHVVERVLPPPVDESGTE